MDKEIFDARKEESKDPSLYMGKRALKYGLTLDQVYALKKESDGDNNYLNHLFFEVGFAAGRHYERNEHHVATKYNPDKVVSQQHIDIQIINAHLPESVHGVSYRGGNDCYTILLNADISEDEKRLSFIHEMCHIWDKDFDRNETVEQIETKTHKA